ncbi:hypothetical protein SAMN05660845_1262 [Flavobacterium swingsii]|uniref:Bacteriocin-type signal sequence-containing protein n=1 Tax=Flavobacterium swingsii TaxID=498292 RepID=A0A1I0XHB3_9FLAO|nr:hypothetical protein [Flavobacterium swingsii]SFB00489.1 hypothetical protein SAMN05660845_1262 [Flavobacterium swingsii]
MLKNILKLDGAQKMSKNEQKSINGGIGGCKQPVPSVNGTCPTGYWYAGVFGGPVDGPEFCQPITNSCR